MAFFCAGSSNEVKKRMKHHHGSKPMSKSSNTAVVSSNGRVVSSNGRVVNPFQDSTNNTSSSGSHSSSKHQPPPPQVISVPHSNSDLPNARKMIVLQEYRPPTSGDSKGLHVRRGETVMVLLEEQDWCRVRNEHGKEGYVPCVHLVAPYSTMRSRQKFTGGPIRPVASGSSIEVMDHASVHGGMVPMYPSRSAGRPRNHSSGDENRVYPLANYNSVGNMHPAVSARINSPLEVVGGGHHHGNMAPPTHPPPPPSTANATVGPLYDQKYSPSTSSGVASLTGTGSPVGQSDGSQHSSFCSIEEGGGHGQEVGGAAEREGAEGAPANVHPNAFHEHAQEISHLARGRATSEANITYSKHGKVTPLLPHAHPAVSHSSKEPSRPLSAEQTHLEGMVNGGDTPPPLPPRSYYCNINSHPPQQQNLPPPPPPAGGESFIPPPPAEFMMNSQDESDPYAAPMDAIPRNQSPHLANQPPRGNNAGDTRYRRDDIRTTDDHGVYSEVYHGYQRPQHPYRHYNSYRLSPNGTEEGMYSIPPSEGSSANSQTSRHSGSRVSSSRTHYSREVMSEVTPNVDQNGSMGRELSHRPHSGNSEYQFGAGGQIRTFRKNLWGVYTVVDNFEAFDENEVNVVESDHVSVWNQDDPEWYWIVKHDTNEEGFVPSNCLKEIVSDNHGLTGTKEVTPHHQPPPDPINVTSSSLPPPLPPKQPQMLPKPPAAPKPPRPLPSGTGFDSTPQRFRDRSTSHVTPQEPRPSSIPPPGNAVSRRRRLNSDGSIKSNSLRGQMSAVSMERREPSISPPNSPPPPYSKYDHNQNYHQAHHNHPHIPPLPLPPHAHTPQPLPPHAHNPQPLPPHAHNLQPLPPRHNSLSQHERPGHASSSSGAYSTLMMQRTWSHGQVPYRRMVIPPPHSNSGSPRVSEEDGREDGIISPPDVFADAGGTLV